MDLHLIVTILALVALSGMSYEAGRYREEAKRNHRYNQQQRGGRR